MNTEKRWFVFRYSVATVATVDIVILGWRHQSGPILGFGCFLLCYIAFSIQKELRRKRD